MLKKVLIFALLTSVILTQTSFGSDFDNMSDYEKAQAAGVYIEEIMKYINDNYMGEKEVSIEKLMQTAIRAIAKDLDEYSDYLSPEEYKEIKEAEQKVWYAPDFVCAFNEDGYPEITEVKQGSKAYQTGLREGNFIKSISDISAYGIGEEEYNTLVTKSDSNSITMKIATNASTVVEMNIPLVSIDNSTVITHDVSKAGKGAEEVKFDDKTVGYIKITSFSYKTDAEFEKAMNSLLKQGCTKLILDLRGNTGGYVEPAIKIAQMIVPQGLIITARDKNGNGENYVSNLKVTPFKKYAVLVDSSTAS
ncbi:MAG: S41 family peptidase, partial [Lachnospirales bacterium]